MEEMNKKQLIKEWLLKNCVNAKGHLDLAHLDFSDFDGDVYINHMKVKKNLHQDHQVVKQSLWQYSQKVEGDLSQNNQIVTGDLYQHSQQVEGFLQQNYQTVNSDLMQNFQKVNGEFYGHKLDGNEYWEERDYAVVRKHKLKTITKEQLAEMGYKLEDDRK